MAASLYHRNEACRLCGSRKLEPVLSLTPTPPANSFVPPERLQEKQPVFPLDVHLCRDCGHLQLVDIVDPEYLFAHYVYTSGAAPVMVAHLRAHAQAVIDRLQLRPGQFVVEAGSNDGTFLRPFKDAGLSVLGVDPARNIAAQANASGVPTLPAFFNVETARRIRTEHGPAKVVAANHVFAHVADMEGLIQGVGELLGPDGVFVFESGYLVDVYEKTLFDTMYHEHIDYHRVGPLRRFFAKNGLELFDAARVDIQGGALRGFAGRPGAHPVSPGLDALEAYERQIGLDRPETFRGYAARIDRCRAELTTLLADIKRQGKRIAAYGAPAKATTLMYHFGLDARVIEYIVDDSPLKTGLFSPGLHVPVLSVGTIYERRPDYLVMLAWNFADAIMAKHAAFRAGGGHFIVPLPQLSVH
ncbi:MAG TPA: class I SAM-dependent methyltransferase [Alphaproteobacteria bacterium]